MDQFVTTYRRDYLWPLSRPPPLVAGPTYGTRCVPVQCRCAPRPHTDPKLYPARVGAPPEVESSRYDQPNAFLLKLYEKYPFLYNTLRSAPKDDLANRLYKDRMRTTYQIDYCKMNEFPNTEYDNLLRAAGVSGTIQDAWTNTLPGCPCRPLLRDNIASRRGIISKMTSPKGISVNKMADSGKHKFEAIPWKSEYQDSISKLGGRIIMEGLHCQNQK